MGNCYGSSKFPKVPQTAPFFPIHCPNCTKLNDNTVPCLIFPPHAEQQDRELVYRRQKSGTKTLATQEIVKVFVTLIHSGCVMDSITGFIERIDSPAPGIVIVKTTGDCRIGGKPFHRLAEIGNGVQHHEIHCLGKRREIRPPA